MDRDRRSCRVDSARLRIARSCNGREREGRTDEEDSRHINHSGEGERLSAPKVSQSVSRARFIPPKGFGKRAKNRSMSAIILTRVGDDFALRKQGTNSRARRSAGAEIGRNDPGGCGSAGRISAATASIGGETESKMRRGM